MEKIKYISLYIFIFYCTSINIALAQDACEIKLNEALEQFNAGHFYTIPSLLKECLEKNQNPGYRQRAYLLLAQTYLLLEDPIGAEESYLKVLEANPEYVTSRDRDPIDLVYLSSKFTASPIFSAYGKLGTNISLIRIINDISISGESGTIEDYTLRLGWQAGLGLTWHYNARLSVNIETNFFSSSFKHTTTNLFQKDLIEFTEKQSSLNVPVLLKYTDDVGSIRPFAYVGYAVNQLLSSTATLSITNKNSSQTSGDIATPNILSQTSPNLNMKSRRQLFTQSVIIGSGFKYKIKLNYIFVDVRYSIGLRNAVDPEQRFSNAFLNWPYADDDFRMDNLSLSVGYIKPLYKPRKLKRARSKSILRKIKKEDEATD